MFVLHMNCLELWSPMLALGPLSFFHYLNLLFILSTPPTNDIVNVAFTCILQTFLSLPDVVDNSIFDTMGAKA